MATTIAVQLAQHFHKFDYRQLPDASKSAVKRLLLDYLGVAVAGSQTESGHAARMFAQSAGVKAESTLIGDTARVPAAQAAFANAISSHSIELDDIDVLALFHFSPPVFSSALATAEQHKASGKQLLVALAAGCARRPSGRRAATTRLSRRGRTTNCFSGFTGSA